MEIPRHWRLRKQRYCLVGDYEFDPETGAKTVAFPPGSNRPRYKLKSNENGYHTKEAFSVAGVVYQAQEEKTTVS